METEWRNTPTPEFSDDNNGSIRDPIPWPTSQDEVSEFTDTGVLVPYQEFLNSDGFKLAAELGDSMEDHVAAEIFRRNASDTTLIRLTLLAVPAWIVCRTRSSLLRFTRDWIGRLIELNREDDTSYQLTKAMSDFDGSRQHAGGRAQPAARATFATYSQTSVQAFRGRFQSITAALPRSF